MKTLLLTLGLAILLGLGVVWLHATPQSQTTTATPKVEVKPAAASLAAVTPTVAMPSTTPSTIVVNTPATVTVTVAITPTPILNGVNLLRLGATGTQSTILGVMHDDGKNGDAVAGDGIYSVQIPFNEPVSGQIQLQVSTAFQGVLKRIASPVTTLNVWGVIVDSSNHFSVTTPPGWSSIHYQDTYTVSSTSTAPVLEGDPGNEVQINILPLNGFTNIQSWLQDYFSGEVDFSLQPVTYYTNPNGIQFALLSGLPGMSSDNTHAFAIIHNDVLEVSVTPASVYGGLFSTMLSTIKGI